MNFDQTSLVKGNLKKLIYVYIFILTICILPIINFAIIFFLNKNLNIYFENRVELKDIFGSWLTPSKTSILVFIFLGISFIFVGFVLLLFLMLVMKKRKFKSQTVYIFFTTFFLILGFFIYSFAEMNYSKIHYLFSFLTDNKFDSELTERVKNIAYKFNKSKSKNIYYNWLDISEMWWLLLVQMASIIIMYSIVQNLVFAKNKFQKDVSKKIEESIKKENVGVNWINKIYNSVFANTEKTISLIMIVISLIVLMPQLVFSISLSMSGSKINSLLKWSFMSKFFLGDKIFDDSSLNVTNYNPAEVNYFKKILFNNSFSSFAIFELPVIAATLVLGTMFIFFTISIRGMNNDSNLFLIQYIIFFIFNIFTITVSSYSMKVVTNLTILWNNEELVTIYANNQGIFKYLNNLLGTSFIMDNNSIVSNLDYIWLYGIEYISEIVISLSFLITTYTIIGYKIIKITKQKKVEKKKIIKQKIKLWKESKVTK